MSEYRRARRPGRSTDVVAVMVGACRGGAVPLKQASGGKGNCSKGARRHDRRLERRAFVATFKAIVISRTASGQAVALTDFDENDLMEGNVILRPEWSTVNYKDGLAVTNTSPMVRRFPMIAGIDAAGTGESFSHRGHSRLSRSSGAG
jgi:hypothetical protein